MTEICVVHLARAANGIDPFAEFLDSYRRFDAGVDHELFVVCKGFAGEDLGEEHEAALRGLAHRRRFIADEGFDLDAYLLAAREVDASFFCFLNSFSNILAEDWLEKLHRQAVRPKVGIVGVTGSFESMRTNLLNDLGGPDPSHLVTARPDLAPLIHDFPPFPNPHIRTNAFFCRRELLLGATNGPIQTKHQAHAFESGRNGLTRQICAQGLSAVVVGRDGRAYDEAEWPESRTFRSGSQENLLIEDNQTRINLDADPERRELLRRYAWGEHANGYGLLKPTGSTPTNGSSPATADPAMAVHFRTCAELREEHSLEPREAFRLAVRKFALDPDDIARRAAVSERFAAVDTIALLRAAQAALNLETAGLAILGSASEVIAQPELLTAFTQEFGAADPVTLVLHAPGSDAAALERALAPAAEAAGLRLEGSPDVVLFLDELDAHGEALLAASAIARLAASGDVETRGPAVFRADQLPVLRALVDLLTMPPEPEPQPEPLPPVEIGTGTYCIEPYEFRTYLPGERILIGKYCSIAAQVTILSGGWHRTDVVATYPFDVQLLRRAGWPDGYAADPTINRSYQSTKPTVIGHDVWIGHGAMVTGGVTVGDGAVVASGAVVFSNVPPYAIVAGNPAKVVRYRFSKEIVERLLRIAWWDWDEATIRERVDWFYRPINEFVEEFDPTPMRGDHDRDH